MFDRLLSRLPLGMPLGRSRAKACDTSSEYTVYTTLPTTPRSDDRFMRISGKLEAMVCRKLCSCGGWDLTCLAGRCMQVSSFLKNLIRCRVLEFSDTCFCVTWAQASPLVTAAWHGSVLESRIVSCEKGRSFKAFCWLQA